MFTFFYSHSGVHDQIMNIIYMGTFPGKVPGGTPLSITTWMGTEDYIMVVMGTLSPISHLLLVTTAQHVLGCD